MSKYPEHQRLKAVHSKSQAIHEFMEWLGDTKGIHLHENCTDEFYENNEDFADAKRELGYDFTFSVRKPLTELVAEFYDINLNRLEKEKCAMLDELRAKHEARTDEGAAST